MDEIDKINFSEQKKIELKIIEITGIEKIIFIMTLIKGSHAVKN